METARTVRAVLSSRSWMWCVGPHDAWLATLRIGGGQGIVMIVEHEPW